MQMKQQETSALWSHYSLICSSFATLYKASQTILLNKHAV